LSVALVYLMRGRDGGNESASGFFHSYRAHPAGCAHELIVAAKGWEGVPGLDDARRAARALSARLIELPDDGYDFGAYFRIARQLDETWLCFLNTHSRIVADDWLAKLRAAADGSGVGAAGATGSWGTLTPSWDGPGATWRGRAIWPLRFARTIRRFPRFPNPHLRSNAVLLRRELLVAFAEYARHPARKSDAHYLESGRGGLSVFLRSQGLRPVVVGADGRSFDCAEWIASSTYRVPGQANLLVADNQTSTYAAADRRMRRILEFSAWGTTFTA